MGSFGGPRTAFGGAGLRGSKGPSDADKGKDTESRDRFGYRQRNIDSDAGDRFRDGRNTNFRRRDGEQDGEGWSTVKPRKSFGHEGAERFNGKMGGERLRDGRPPRDDQEKPGLGNRRGQDSFSSRDKEFAGDGDGRPRNGVRGKPDSWFKQDVPNDGLTTRERIEKATNWRARDNKDADGLEDRSGGRGHDRRWGRDREQRAEREPEWMDEPADSKSGGHTEEDFKRFMEQMKARDGGGVAKAAAPAVEPTMSPPEAAQSKAPSAPPPIETGPDKFFMAFAAPPGLDGTTPGVSAEPKDVLTSKPAGKSSRFTSFFNAAQEEKRRQEAQAQSQGQQLPIPLNSSSTEPQGSAPPEEEKAAFQQLLMKLQKQSLEASPSPAATQSLQGPPAASSTGPEPTVQAAADPTSPEAHVQHRGGPGGSDIPADDPRKKMPWAMEDIIAPQPMLPQQTAAARQDQLLQNLVCHRAESGQRIDQGGSRNDSNTEFLMNLMRSQPEAPHSEQAMLRMPQPQKSATIPHVQEREPDFAQGNRFSQPQTQHMQQHPQLQQQQPQSQPQPPMQQQQRQMRPQPPGAFMDDPAFHGEQEPRHPQQPQLLQRPPPPPGLDQMGPGPGVGPGPNWMPSAPGPGPQQRILPPPGLPGGPNRNMPAPNIYPPNFPPQGPGFPSPEGMGMPPRNMQPPPGIYGGPPPGFFPPPGGFQGPPPDAPFGAFERMPPGVPRGFPRS